MYIYISYSQHLQHIVLLVQLTHSNSRTQHATGQCAEYNVFGFAYEDECEVQNNIFKDCNNPIYCSRSHTTKQGGHACKQ